jgi:hypothetical protein
MGTIVRRNYRVLSVRSTKLGTAVTIQEVNADALCASQILVPSALAKLFGMKRGASLSIQSTVRETGN